MKSNLFTSERMTNRIKRTLKARLAKGLGFNPLTSKVDSRHLAMTRRLIIASIKYPADRIQYIDTITDLRTLNKMGIASS